MTVNDPHRQTLPTKASMNVLEKELFFARTGFERGRGRGEDGQEMRRTHPRSTPPR